MSLFRISFPFLYILNSLQSSLTVNSNRRLPVKFVCLLKRLQRLGLVWRNRKKISQIIKDYFYLPVLPLNYFMLLCQKASKYDIIFLHPRKKITQRRVLRTPRPSSILLLPHTQKDHRHAGFWSHRFKEFGLSRLRLQTLWWGTCNKGQKSRKFCQC